MDLMETLIVIGLLFAGVAIAALCGLGLFVWFSGGRSNPRAK